MHKFYGVRVHVMAAEHEAVERIGTRLARSDCLGSPDGRKLVARCVSLGQSVRTDFYGCMKTEAKLYSTRYSSC